ncbi:MAG: hypothetical protein QM783_08820 [Phycisphaerales bacterium]
MLPACSKNAQNARARIAGEAAQVRAFAGTSYSRRGSVLVLVVGVLALLAIIVVVYTSVGQADVRGGRALVNKARLDDQSRAIGDYITRIVADDASATKIQPVSLPNSITANLSVHEGMDYPYTSTSVRSILTTPYGVNAADRDFARFDPSGNITKPYTGGGLDPRTSSDPFLAATEPTWINSGFATLGALPTPGALLGHQRDWAHMSLVSPSGLPVNLANLRGNFPAASGFSTRPYNANTQPMMSDWMYLWRAGSAQTGYGVTSAPIPVNSTVDYNTPSVWSNDRTDTFRPVTWNPNRLALGDVKFMGNMLGDADGDGFYDSLWQELVDVSDPANPVNLLPGGTGGGVRWFVAPRIIDLSSMVNVNTATSFSVAPDAENPAGLTPSDVDLERLLTSVDVRQYFGINPSTHLVGGSNANLGWAGATPGDFTNAGRWAFAGILESRATGMTEVIDNGVTDEAGTGLNSPLWLADMGVTRGAGAPPALGSVTRKLLYTTVGKDESSGQLRNPVGTNANYFLKQASGFGLADELELRKRNGLNDPSARSRLEAAAQPTPGLAMISPFRSERDLPTELDAGIFTGNNVNIGGESMPRGFVQHFYDSRHLLTTLSGARPFAYSASFINTGLANSTAARELSDIELRTDVTTLIEKALSDSTQAINNTRKIYPLSSANAIFQNYAMALSPFLGVVDPLGPTHANSESLWAPATTGPAQRALTLSFGGVTYDAALTGTQVGETIAPQFKGRAAEIAVRTGAHMALNLLATRDDTRIVGTATQPDNRPLVATVLLDEAHRSDMVGAMYGGTGGRRFPFWQSTTTGRLGTAEDASMAPPGATITDYKAYTFDLNGGQPGTVQRLANGNSDTSALPLKPYAVNIYATQPQPFITAVVSFDMYCDAPRSIGGDSMASGPSDSQGEWYVSNPGDPANNVPPTTESLGVTIKGNVDANNPDFLMECVAFQVTNPFDVAITFGDSTGAFSYYFEFAGKYYDARQYDDNGMPMAGPLRLLPRQSMCFYVLSQEPAQILQRWRAADPGVDALGSMGSNPVNSWLKKQLAVITGGGGAFRTVQINRANGVPINPNGVLRVLNATPNADENKVVKLWRVTLDRAGGETSAATNRPENDYLVDRLHDPSFGDGNQRAGLFRRLKDDQNRFINIPAGPEPTDTPYYQGPPSQRENVGYAITMFGGLRRRTDPLGGPMPGQTSDMTTGVMPAWCMEPKVGINFEASINSRNIVDSNTGIPNTSTTSSLSQNDFTSFPWGARLTHDMFVKGLARQYTAAAKHPASRTGVGAAGSGGIGDDPADLIGNDIGADINNASNGVGWLAGGKAAQLPVYPRRKTAATATDVALQPLRPADLLMPWAIGPYSYGQIDPGFANDEVKHTTLSEAMAFGLNYSRARATNAEAYEFQISRVLDRCHLPLDRYVPFNDASGPTPNAMWDYNQGDPDPSISNGVPFALNILDRFRTTRYGTADSMVPGLININTAPLSVLRMLPFLTPPSSDLYAGGDNLGLTGHWMTRTAGTGPFALKARQENGQLAARSLWDDHDAQGTAMNNRWDVAAAIAAYRDQQAVVARGGQMAETADLGGNGRVFIDFSRGMKLLPSATTAVAGNDGKSYFHGGADARPGRPFMTNVPAIRQDPGFQSPGEVLMAVVRDNTQRFATQNLTDVQLKQLGADRLETKLNANGTQTTLTSYLAPVKPIVNVNARGLTTGTEQTRTQAVGMTGMLPVRPPTTGTGPDTFVQGGYSSDYDRKLGIANALMNCITTSSDVYCATSWSAATPRATCRVFSPTPAACSRPRTATPAR